MIKTRATAPLSIIKPILLGSIALAANGELTAAGAWIHRN